MKTIICPVCGSEVDINCDFVGCVRCPICNNKICGDDIIELNHAKGKQKTEAMGRNE